MTTKRTKTIWKYPLDQIGQVIQLEIPRAAKLLTVQLQGGTPTLWALVEKNAPYEATRQVILLGTGENIKRELGDYLGTVQSNIGLVWHAFEVPYDN